MASGLADALGAVARASLLHDAQLSGGIQAAKPTATVVSVLMSRVDHLRLAGVSALDVPHVRLLQGAEVFQACCSGQNIPPFPRLFRGSRPRSRKALRFSGCRFPARCSPHSRLTPLPWGAWRTVQGQALPWVPQTAGAQRNTCKDQTRQPRKLVARPGGGSARCPGRTARRWAESWKPPAPAGRHALGSRTGSLLPAKQ